MSNTFLYFTPHFYLLCKWKHCNSTTTLLRNCAKSGTERWEPGWNRVDKIIWHRIRGRVDASLHAVKYLSKKKDYVMDSKSL